MHTVFQWKRAQSECPEFTFPHSSCRFKKVNNISHYEIVIVMCYLARLSITANNLYCVFSPGRVHAWNNKRAMAPAEESMLPLLKLGVLSIFAFSLLLVNYTI